MKVMLINILADHEIRGPHPIKASDIGAFPHLGLMYIASSLLEDDTYDVKLLDMPLDRINLLGLEDSLRKFVPDVVGITTYTDCLYDWKLAIDSIRHIYPDIFICAGGPHIEIYPEETLNNFPIDCIIRGDGERAFKELCNCLRDDLPWHSVEGVGYKDKKRVQLNTAAVVNDLDSLSFPNRELSNMSNVHSAVHKGGSIISICTSRGCPLPCTFCNSPYKNYRLRSVENVMAEITQCHEKYGASEFFFFDDLFNISKKRVVEMSEAINALPFRFNWSFRGRINNLDKGTIKIAFGAGCNRIHFGVEAGTERIWKIYKKGLKAEKVQDIFAACREIGLETIATCMIGAPTETREEIEQTIKFIFDLKPNYIEPNVLIPYPYTKIYSDMLAEGCEDYWKEYIENPRPKFKPKLANNLIPEEELFLKLNDFYRRFYFRPSFIWQEIKNLGGVFDFTNKAWHAFRLLVATKS